MKCKVITIFGNDESETAAKICVDSAARFGQVVERFAAKVPADVDSAFKTYGLYWNYPWNGKTVRDMGTGLVKVGYQTAEPKKRMACFLSHYELWRECVEMNESVVILEHDAYFTHSIPWSTLNETKKQVISLNMPQSGATPQAGRYLAEVRGNKGNQMRVVDVPYVKEPSAPAGLPGNSAYYIKPRGARKLLELVDELGAWPNDAIMCKQLMPGMLGCLYPFITKVQQTKSSTTL